MQNVLQDLKFVVMAIIRNPFKKGVTITPEVDMKFWKAIVVMGEHLPVNPQPIDPEYLYSTLEYAGFKWNGVQWIMSDPDLYQIWKRGN